MKILLTLVSLFLFNESYAKTNRVLVQLFEWNWKNIAKECETYLGPNGFYGVQVSPPNEHAIVEGRPWYERYQPVSYKLISRSGNEREFRNMVSRCKRAGVSIYVDAVINHMAWNPNHSETRQGIGGTPYSRYSFADFSNPYQFNRCRGGDNDDIRNWGNRFEVHNCNLALLPDLKTSDPYVRNKLKGFLRKLKTIGVKGLRVDAAKHIPAKDLRLIYANNFGKEHIYQEVIDLGRNGPVRSEEYMPLGKITNFQYGLDLGRIFLKGDIAWLNNLGDSWGYTPSEKSVVFIENHDTQRGHGPTGDILNYKYKKTYTLARAFMLIWPYGQPVLMSGYKFKNGTHGPPRQGLNPCRQKEWVCEHRNAHLAPLIKARSSYKNPFITGWNTNAKNIVAFTRDHLYLFLFNNTKNDVNSFKTPPLKAGWYEDLKTKERFRVDNNKVNLKVSGKGFRALRFIEN